MRDSLIKDDVCTSYPTLVTSLQSGRWRQTGSGNAQMAATIRQSVVVISRAPTATGALCRSRWLRSNIRSPSARRPPSSRRRRPLVTLFSDPAGLCWPAATIPPTASRRLPKDDRRRTRDTPTTTTKCPAYQSASSTCGTRAGAVVAHRVYSLNQLCVANQFCPFFYLLTPVAASCQISFF